MCSKVTVALLFLNVVLFFYIFHYEKKWNDERATMEARRRVLGPEVAAIDSLTRTARGGETIKLERSQDSAERANGGWILTQPYVWPANPNAVARITKELEFLEHFTTFTV